jgi:hypothetical protein
MNRWANAAEVKAALEAIFFEKFGSKEAEQKARAEQAAAAAKAKKVSDRGTRRDRFARLARLLLSQLA